VTLLGDTATEASPSPERAASRGAAQTCSTLLGHTMMVAATTAPLPSPSHALSRAAACVAPSALYSSQSGTMGVGVIRAHPTSGGREQRVSAEVETGETRTRGVSTGCAVGAVCAKPSPARAPDDSPYGKGRHTAKDGCSSSSPEVQKNNTVLLCTVTQCAAALHPHTTLNKCRVTIPRMPTQCTAKLQENDTVHSSSSSSCNMYSSGGSLQHGEGAATFDSRRSSLDKLRDVVAQHQRLFAPVTPLTSN